MWRRLRAAGFRLCIGSACAVSGTADASDWPAWMGPLAQNRSDAKDLPSSFDRKTGANVRWEAPLGTVAFGAPTISDGRVIVGTNYAALRGDPRFAKLRGGVVVCLDETTGERIWTLASPERTEGFPDASHMPQQRWGICSSPTIDDDRIYVVTNGDDVLCLDVHGLADGNDGVYQDEAMFMANEGDPPVPLSETDGDILWRFDIPSELDVAPHDVGSSTVLVAGDLIYLSTSNGLGTKNPVDPLRPDAPAFIALNKWTGELVATENERLSARLYHAQWSSASYGRVARTGLVFLGGGDGWCYAFRALEPRSRDRYRHLLPGDSPPNSPNLFPVPMTTVWKYDCNPPHFKFRDGEKVYFYQGDERVFRGRKDLGKSTAGISNGDGTFAAPCQVLATPVLHRDRVYVAIGRDPTHGLGRGALHCIDATRSGDITADGTLWRYDGIGRTLSAVAIDDDLVYAADLGGTLHCLDADTGTVYWTQETGEETWGNPLVADGKVWLTTTESLWILKSDPVREVVFHQRGGSETAPVAAQGTVFAFLRGSLYALSSPD